MSKILEGLIVATIAVIVQGCDDTCGGKPNGPYRSYCGPCHMYYECIEQVITYKYCSNNHQCLIKDKCGACKDSCTGKPNGKYPSLDNPRPFYYICHNEFLSYRTCHPNEVFNAWTKTCKCYEVFCEKGDDYQPSMCGNGGCSGYVKCVGGFAVVNGYHRCSRPRPYFCCRTHVCVSSSTVCGRCRR